MALEGDGVVDDGGEFFLVVGDDDEGLARTLTEGLNRIALHKNSSCLHKPQMLIENQNLQ